MTRSEALAKLRAQVAAGSPIIGAGAGHRPLGEVRRGRRHRPDHHLQLRPLPHGRPRFARRPDALRRRQRDRRGHGPRGAAGRRATRPVLAGVCGTDPFRLMDVFLRRARAHRLLPACRTSRPSACSTARSAPNLEETGMGYGLEVDMIRTARELDLLTRPYVFTPDEARGDGRGRRGRPGAAHGADDRRHDRRRDGDDPRRAASPLIQAMHDAAKRDQPGRPRALPRRPDRRAGRRRLRARRTPRASSASSAPLPWSACRPRSR